MSSATTLSQKGSGKARLLDAALSVVRSKGFAAATVDDLCAAAGLTKGAFFHHFRSKDELAVAAANYWSEMTGGFFASAAYHQHPAALDRVLGYIDFRKSILRGAVKEFTCLVGTMVQEAYDSHPAIREACARSIFEHAAKVETDIAEAMRDRGLVADWTAHDLALHTQAVLQGAFILAKAQGGPEIAMASVDHLRRYIELLFAKARTKETSA